MKALVLDGIGDLNLREVANPVVKSGEVLVKIKASGICGSDIPRVYTKGTYHFPTIPGHEFSGEIVEVGENVDAGLIGKKTAVFPILPCRECASCQIGEFAQCKNYNYFGSRCDGGFAEYLSVPVWNLVFGDDNLTYEEMAMAEPAAVAVHALRQAGVEIGDTVAIFGAGPIGLMLAEWAKAWGATKVILSDIDDNKIEFAKSLGHEYVINSLKENAVERIMEITDGCGADLCLEGAGASVTFDQCMCAARTFGRVVLMGNPSGDMTLTQKGYWEILRKQLTIKGTWNSSYIDMPKNDWKLALNAMAKGLIDVKPFITHRLSLEEYKPAFEMMRDRSAFFNKVMFTF